MNMVTVVARSAEISRGKRSFRAESIPNDVRVIDEHQMLLTDGLHSELHDSNILSVSLSLVVPMLGSANSLTSV